MIRVQWVRQNVIHETIAAAVNDNEFCKRADFGEKLSFST